MRKVRLGVVAVRLHNPVTNQSTCVYAFQDGGSQLTLLRKSVADEIRLHGMPRLQKCGGMHTTANILMESVDLSTCGIEEPKNLKSKALTLQITFLKYLTHSLVYLISKLMKPSRIYLTP